MPCGCGKSREKRAAARAERNALRAASPTPPQTRYTVTDPKGNVQPFSSYVEARRAAKATGGDLRPTD